MRRVTLQDEFALTDFMRRNILSAKQATVAGVDCPSLIQSGTKWSEPRESTPEALRRRSGAAACRRCGHALQVQRKGEEL